MRRTVNWGIGGSGASSPRVWVAWRWLLQAPRRCPRPAGGSGSPPCGSCSTCCAARPPDWPPLGCAGVRWRGLLVAAIDGTTMTTPDTAANLTEFSKHADNHGGSGYRLIRLMVLVCCGTRTVLDAVFGPTSTGKVTYTYPLLRSLHQGMIVLLDRNFGAHKLVTAIAGTGAEVLVRLKNKRKLAVLARYPDGSFLSMLGGVRVIECAISITTSAGARTGVYRLATTVLDHHRYPAFELVRLYHERWEIEVAYLALRHTLLTGPVLRSTDPTGLRQEMWALLTLYQIRRIAMVTAVESVPGTDPDRAGFTLALETAKDLIINAQNVVTDTIDLIGDIGRAVLDNLLPPRRPRVSARKVKSPLSRYNKKDPDRPQRSTPITALDLTPHTGQDTPLPGPDHPTRTVNYPALG